MVPGGVPGGPGVPWASRGGSQGASWALFGRVLAEHLPGGNAKMVLKCFQIGPKSHPQNNEEVQQDMADPIFGVPGPGGAQKRRK